jgi:ABC-2 type transport system permease protein
MRLLASIQKEFLVLIRDIPGLAVLFLMPLAMIVVVTLVQDNTMQNLKESRIEVLFVDNDGEILGTTVRNGLQKSKLFQLVEKSENRKPDSVSAKNAVTDGKFKLAIIIPKNASKLLRAKLKPMVQSVLTGGSIKNDTSDKVNIRIFTDPSLKETFRQAVITSLNAYTSKIENRILFKILGEEIGSITGTQPKSETEPADLIAFEETPALSDNENSIKPNSVQHNVPAWALFAMFFIVIPMSGNMIKERDDGSFFRLMTMPGNYFTVIGSKLILYLGVTFVQFVLMLLVGIYLLPIFGLPVLQIGSHYFALFFMGLISGTAAAGYGTLVGTLTRTHEQAGVFGSVSVIILAALGGVWYPVYAMPEIMQKISVISPLNWGLTGFYKIFLRNSGFLEILPQVTLLSVFSLFCMISAYLFQKAKRSL